MKFSDLVAKYPRFAITGEPGTGKTSLCEQIRDKAVIHTDDWKALDWRAVPFIVMGACSQHPSFVVEGVRAADAVRMGLAVDAILVLNKAKEDQTPAQINMGAGIATVVEEVRAAHPEIVIIDESELEWPTLDRSDVPVQRFTYITLDRASNKLEPTGVTGGIRIIGAELALPGVFEYNRGGRIVREYSPPEELFAPESLKSLQGVPVLVDHPYADGGLVDANSFKRLAVGHLENPREENGVLVGDIVINDAQTVQRVIARELTEVSLGSTNTRDMTPGFTPDGKPYDLIQRTKRYNHTAIGPAGWSRKDVGWTLDAKDNQIQAAGLPQEDNTMGTPAKASAVAIAAATTTTTDSQLPVPGQLPAPAAVAPAATADAPPGAPPPAAPTPAPAPGEQPALSAEDIVALKAIATAWPQINQLLNSGHAPAPTTDTATPPVVETPKDPTMDAADLERRIQETATLRGEAEKILGPDYKVAGKSNRDIRCDVIKACAPTFTLDAKAADESVNAAYSMALQVYAEREAHKARGADSLAALMNGTRGSQTLDAGDEGESAESKSQNAWKTKAS